MERLFSAQAVMARITALRNPSCSSEATASMVVPAGEQTISLSCAGCWLVSSTILVVKIRKNTWAFFQDPHFAITWAYFAKHSVSSLVQPFAFLAVPLISLYNGKPGMKMKYFFYAFYPVHLAILGLIRVALNR